MFGWKIAEPIAMRVTGSGRARVEKQAVEGEDSKWRPVENM
jgi:hypothetical protein